jgi:pimeloyl-ACP methyl ester carboxylesterase/membrane protein DedA with SNARE-associated domain
VKRQSSALLGGYAVLLVASLAYRSLHPKQELPDSWERVVTVGAVETGRVTARPVRLAVFDSAPPGIPAPPVIVLLHGSPGDNGEVTRLARALANRYRVIAPDLPGFGGSTWSVPDYSIRAHARYVAQLLDSLGIPRAHVLGFSMGGGVALTLADMVPGRVASVVLLSSIGAQEFELLGDYYLNHAIHGIQLGGLWLIYSGLPHFGAWDGGMMTLQYARNFYDTDQRPLRAVMERLQAPMLIIQGKSDPLVPASIASEHHRIVPQSELLLLDGDHFMAFQRSAELAGPIADFVSRAETGAATTRATADPERIAAARTPFDPRKAPPANGIGFVVLLLLIAAATLISEDLTCIATGLLVSRGAIGFLPATLACLVGIVGGDLLLYAAGRFLGRPALIRRPLRWFLTDADVARTSAWFVRKGPALVLTTRFIPGTRLPTYLAAGVLHTRFLPFFGFFLLAALLWTPLLVGLAVLYGETVLTAFHAYRRWSFPVVIVSALALLVVMKLVVPLFSWRGRRLLLSRWRRLARWEFWPMGAFYPPVVLYILWLGLKHRSLALFTAANPGIPAGGFAGESKWEILQGLRAAAGDVLPASTIIPDVGGSAERAGQVSGFVAAHRLAWPIVLKPDIGERGAGVAIVANADEVLRYFERAGGNVVAQEFVTGHEFGVFYYRYPSETSGRIFSITDKRLPSVTGDGRATLETLILRDDRAVCIARFLLAKHAGRLWSIPKAGARVPLVEVGTHCRGAAFFDGTGLATPALEEVVDRISRGFKGFYFGRYDVRADSVEAFQAGRFRIIELNGATSEATSIYDPANRLLSAYRTLFEQWRILFQIGAENRDRGAPVATLGELLELLRRHRGAKRLHAMT